MATAGVERDFPEFPVAVGGFPNALLQAQSRVAAGEGWRFSCTTPPYAEQAAGKILPDRKNYAMLPVIIPQKKHANSRATAVAAMFRFDLNMIL